MPTILGIRIDDLPRDELLGRLSTWLASDKSHTVVTPNPEMVLAAESDHELHGALAVSNLAIPDGVGLSFAAVALGEGRLLHRLPGVDVLRDIAKLCEVYESKLLLLGGYDGAGESAADKLRTELPTLAIETLELGEILNTTSVLLTPAVIAELLRIAPQVVAVAVGQGRGGKQGRQERLVQEIAAQLPSVRIVIGVGGAFDFIAGRTARAPRTFRRLGLEWLWRLAHEPWRLRRIGRAVILFPLVVARTAVRKRGFVKPFVDVGRELVRHFFLPHTS